MKNLSCPANRLRCPVVGDFAFRG